MITLDFETEAIESRPRYPPRPVGLAVRWPDGRAEYMAFGHPGDSTHTLEQVRDVVLDAFGGRYGPCLFHNGTFDIDVAQTWFNAPWPRQWDDTLYLAFLDDPYSDTLSLKPLSERHLGMPPEERDAVFDWLASDASPVASVVRRSPKKAGAFISKAPARLVAPYAIGDVERTYRLYQHLAVRVFDRGMRRAYQRELAVTPITLGMERGGVRVDVLRLGRLQDALTKLIEDTEKRIHKRLGRTFNVASGEQLAEALRDAELLSHETLTPTGKQSTSMEVLVGSCTDATLVRMLALYAVATKYRSGFVQPWLEASARTGGYILPRFNQVRGTDRGGARSGRYSSSDPNFQNIPANVSESRNAETLGLLAKALAKYGVPGFIGLRDYLLPDEGCYWCSCDYSQQELRILAHFENGALMQAYLQNPKMDVHDYVRGLIRDATGIDFPRKAVKTLVFGIIYGMGIARLAEATGMNLEEATKLREALYRVLPGLRELSRRCASEGTSAAGMRTWGDRIYHAEPPQLDAEGDVVRSFEYKMLNYRIQGSAADCTKEGMLRVAALNVGRIAVQVHDEINVMVERKRDAAKVAEAMADVEFNVPMLADAKVSLKTWAQAC